MLIISGYSSRLQFPLLKSSKPAFIPHNWKKAVDFMMELTIGLKNSDPSRRIVLESEAHLDIVDFGCWEWN